jgi:hypothetical protein
MRRPNILNGFDAALDIYFLTLCYYDLFCLITNSLFTNDILLRVEEPKIRALLEWGSKGIC